MSYRITYSPALIVKHQRSKIHPAWVAGVMIAVAIAAVGAVFPQFGDDLRALLFPAADADAVMAFQEMVAQVGEGTTVSDAVAAFCRKIIENAQPLA